MPIPFTLSGSSIYTNAVTFLIGTAPKHGMLSGSVPDLMYTPEPGYNGIDSLTFRANDGHADSPWAEVTLEVLAFNDPPTLQDIADQIIPQDTSTPRVPFQIADPDDAATSLVVTAVSSDLDLVPAEGIVLAGTGGTRRLAVTPAAGQSGSAVIRVTVTDPSGAQASDAFVLTVVPPMTRTFENAGLIVLPEAGPGDPYPSILHVDAASGTVLKAQVHLLGLTHSQPDDIDLLLVSPAGQKALILSDAGGTVPVEAVDLTFDDDAATRLPNTSGITPGTYKPSNFGSGDLFPGPAPAAPYATSLGAFRNRAADGDWALFVMDDEAPVGGSLTGGWSLTLILRANTPPSITDIPDQQVLQNSAPISRPFTITDVETAETDLMVTVASSNPILLPESAVELSGTGANRSLRVTPTPGEAGIAMVTLRVSDAGGLATDTMFDLIVKPIVTRTFSQPAPIIIPASGPASPYPSAIMVTGVEGSVQTVEVRCHGFSHTRPDDVDVLLVAPGGQKALVLSDAGGSTAVEDVDLDLSDSAGSHVPNSGPLVTATYRPSNFGTGDLFPEPAPAAPYATTLDVFKDTDPNGTWALYVLDDNDPESGVLAGGWEIAITTADLSPGNGGGFAFSTAIPQTVVGDALHHTSVAPPTDLALDEGGAFVAISYFGANIEIWDIHRDQLLVELPDSTGAWKLRFFGREADRLVACCNDMSLRIWDWRLGQELLRLYSGRRTSCLTISPDGMELAAGGYDPAVVVRFAVPWWFEQGNPLFHKSLKGYDLVPAGQAFGEPSIRSEASARTLVRPWSREREE